ncbi:MAG TPA: VanZ family protein [Burkholderiales bacterium]|nr:VanZ family protein [Burkholderiales bacterium]
MTQTVAIPDAFARGVRVINHRWFRGLCIVVSLTMASLLFLEAHAIARVNLVPEFMHRIEHISYFGAMAALLAHGLGRRGYWVAGYAILLVGALDEWHQLYVPGRNGSIYDWLVDLLGVSAALLVYRYAAVRLVDGWKPA